MGPTAENALLAGDPGGGRSEGEGNRDAFGGFALSEFEGRERRRGCGELEMRGGERTNADETVDEGLDGALNAFVDGERVVLGIDVAVVVQLADDNAVERSFDTTTKENKKKETKRLKRNEINQLKK